MEIAKIPIDKIHAAAYNPRKDLQPGDLEYDHLEHSIERFGYVDPIIWNKRTGNIVGGHQRYKILLSQGHTEIEVSVVDLSEEEGVQYRSEQDRRTVGRRKTVGAAP